MPFDPQIYRLASIARDKLCREAARASHDLRVLVAHANILDDLLIELNAPQGGSVEYYGFNLLPQNAAKRTERSVRRKVVVTVEESHEHELEDEGDLLQQSRHLNSDTSPLSLPMLSHDSESESDSGSDSDLDSDDSDDFETAITPASPTEISSASVSAVDEEDVEPDEGDLALHRTTSVWRLFGSISTPSEERQKRKDVKPIDAVTKEVQRLRLSTT